MASDAVAWRTEMSGVSGRAPAAVAAWWSYVVVDFLAHGVILAPWWRATKQYWLPPLELFKRIPLGYAAFGVYCAALTWLLARLCGERPGIAMGLRVGAISGGVFGVVAALGAYSALRIPPSFLLVGPAVGVAASAMAGAAAAWVSGAERRWRRAGLVFGIGVLVSLVGVIVQSLRRL